jgi:hypothetical protein
MLDFLFLLPIGSSISGKLIPQLLTLKTWCNKHNSDILTVTGMPHNFARNFLATGGKGFDNPTPPDAKWVIWIDSDIVFSIEQLELLIRIDHPFVCGWYVSDDSDSAMCGNWDVDYFMKHRTMPFLKKSELTRMAVETPNKLVEVSYSGMGFMKIRRDVIGRMTYPYFELRHVSIGGKQDLSSEDVSFCLKCYEETGIKPAICPALRVGHLKERIL